MALRVLNTVVCEVGWEKVLYVDDTIAGVAAGAAPAMIGHPVTSAQALQEGLVTSGLML